MKFIWLKNQLHQWWLRSWIKPAAISRRDLELVMKGLLERRGFTDRRGMMRRREDKMKEPLKFVEMRNEKTT